MNDNSISSLRSIISPLKKPRNIAIIFSWIIIGALFFSLSTINYLLYHSVAEIFSIVVACTIFILAWNSRRYLENHYLLFIGIAYFFIGIIDLFHTLTYEGMGIFPISDANTATQLWVSARYLQSISLLIAPFFIVRKVRMVPVFAIYTMVSVLLILSIFSWDIFPAAFISGSGLTTFKVMSEYVIACILIVAIWQLVRQRTYFDRKVFIFLLSSIVITVISEMAFTLYSDVYGILNMIGHLLKILAFFLIYKALVETGLKSPFELLFRELKQTERDLNHAQTVAKLGNWRIDVYNNTITWSDQTYEIFGIPKHEHVTYERFLDLVHPDDREAVDTEWNAALHGESYNLEHRIIANDTIKWVREVAELEFDANGVATGGFGTIQDITENKKIEQMKDEFIGLVSHELRTPLTIVIGSLKSALSPGISPEDMRELIDNAIDGTESLTEILENMLELSRHQAGRLQLELKPVDIMTIAEKVIKKISNQDTAHTICTDIPDTLPPVNADALRVERILYNLVENAVKYSRKQSSITISCHQEDSYVITEIKDQGEGITPADVEKLFEQFERLPESAHIKSGVGLGLVVCKRLVEAQDGWIDVTSMKGSGSTFFFALPLHRR